MLKIILLSNLDYVRTLCRGWFLFYSHFQNKIFLAMEFWKFTLPSKKFPFCWVILLCNLFSSSGPRFCPFVSGPCLAMQCNEIILSIEMAKDRFRFNMVDTANTIKNCISSSQRRYCSFYPNVWRLFRTAIR